ncbi:MAG: UDP-3-O-(3-hydroxymyristoyl)glucosamine N-acyltransferase [Saprospiraceae bacterium]|nr:UDP-3-O-(3-hydroxymyristoyl)glucosamine N-acyltransferase [Saprospiraceae bacterium]
MKFPVPVSISSIADQYNLKIIGNPDTLALGINEIHKVKAGDITFVDVEKYYKKSLYSEATIIIINKETECPPGKVLLICEQPFEIYNQIVWEYRPFSPLLAQTGDNLNIGSDSVIEHGVHIGHDVKIGRNCYIQSGVYIGDFTEIGDNVEIQSGALIGTDAFYFKKIGEQYKKWRSGGKVIIENDVSIGAGCTINRGVSGETIVGSGTKMDCQIHIGHGVVIGKNCLLAAQVGIAGKTTIGNNCVIYGQVGIAQNLVIGDNVTIYAQSGISKNLESGQTYFGSPATEAKEKFKEMASLRMLSKSFETDHTTSI